VAHVALVAHRDRTATTTGAVQPGPHATDSEPAHHLRDTTTIEDDRLGRHVTDNTPVRRRHVAMTTPVVQDRHDRYAAVDPALPMVSVPTGEPMTSGGHIQASQPTDLRVRATSETAIAVVDRADLSVVMMTGVHLERVALRVSNAATDQPDRLVAVHGRLGQVNRTVVPAAQIADRSPVQAALRVVHDRDRAERDNAHDVNIRQVEQEVAVSDRRMTIAIDGPAAAGKSTVGEIVAQKIDCIYFDTGVLYRALTLLALERGVAPSDESALADLAAKMDIHVGRPTVDDGRQVDVRLNDRDVTHSLRTPAIDRNVSAVSAHAAARLALLEQQRRIGRSGRVVMVGRDIGTVVLPDAELKIFLDASPEERARRRCLQLAETGRPLPYEQVLADMIRRDRIDSERDVAPLMPAADAIVVDSDSLTIEEVAAVIVEHAQQRLGAVCG